MNYQFNPLTYRQVAKYIYKNIGKIVAYYHGYNPEIVTFSEIPNEVVTLCVNEFMEIQKDITKSDFELHLSDHWETIEEFLADYTIYIYVLDEYYNKN